MGKAGSADDTGVAMAVASNNRAVRMFHIQPGVSSLQFMHAQWA